ncbi:hypothetical protein P3T76_014483 [Phytophthora citrophthora]|uniref:Uncharacterized protein n=1 Tax=Phytophthora citrophthora TaxID=4793 RepID=A0AAD9G0W5_9STRA|nr:hypothetical protein P3T76_014483 [Phytophthora citrophthora]
MVMAHALQVRPDDPSEFGFVDLVEGTTVQSVSVEDSQGLPYLVPASVRCRAWFKDGYVEAVVPGLGLCRTRLGNGVSEVSHESETSTQVFSAFSSLNAYFTPFEASAVVNNLLEVIGSHLHYLKLCTPTHSNDALDLSVLSAVCPHLESLNTIRFDVVVSVHNEALRLWPIRELTICDNTRLADLTSCLQNSDLRMARELVEIFLESMGQEYDEGEKLNLSAHNGDFLSVTKEKVPIESKVAMISVVSSGHHSKALHRLHDDVLRLVFVLTSTPAQRSVRFWPTRSR